MTLLLPGGAGRGPGTGSARGGRGGRGPPAGGRGGPNRGKTCARCKEKKIKCDYQRPCFRCRALGCPCEDAVSSVMPHAAGELQLAPQSPQPERPILDTEGEWAQARDEWTHLFAEGWTAGEFSERHVLNVL
jgi:hypothetical protein